MIIAVSALSAAMLQIICVCYPIFLWKKRIREINIQTQKSLDVYLSDSLLPSHEIDDVS